MQPFPSRLGAARCHSGCKGNRIHRTGTGGADRLDSKAAVLEQAVDHAPDKGAMCPTSLESESHVFHRTGLQFAWIDGSSFYRPYS
jgi:hypothetical protein